MKIGFTGTQRGGNILQEQALERLLLDLKPTELHHGDCVGADAQAHQIACNLYLDEQLTRIVPHIHPPTDNRKRAWCEWDTAVIYEPKPYLDRNHDIVDVTNLLIAMPFENREEFRSGTWATVRYSRKLGKPRLIIWPNGSVSGS